MWLVVCVHKYLSGHLYHLLDRSSRCTQHLAENNEILCALVYRIEVQARLLILIKKFPESPLHDLYFMYCVLLMPARLFNPALLFGTLEYLVDFFEFYFDIRLQPTFKYIYRSRKSLSCPPKTNYQT